MECVNVVENLFQEGTIKGFSFFCRQYRLLDMVAETGKLRRQQRFGVRFW